MSGVSESVLNADSHLRGVPFTLANERHVTAARSPLDHPGRHVTAVGAPRLDPAARSEEPQTTSTSAARENTKPPLTRFHERVCAHEGFVRMS